MTKDYYKILGVAEFDTAENIKTAYRKLARKYHPDIAGNSKDALLRFKEINEAYETLSNSVKKAEYDKARRFYNYAHSENTTDKSYTQTTTNPQNRSKGFSFNWEEFLRKNKNLNEERVTAPKKGEDVYSDIEISTLDAINGTVKTVNMLQTQICPKCKGKKFINGGICNHCSGKGETVTHKKFNVKIPAGIKDKSKIRLAGEGSKGINGGYNGDLYLTIHIIKDEKFKVEELNIYKTIPVAPHEAVLGTNIKVNSPTGVVSLNIAPNTQNGQKIRLANCGLVQNNKFGDMIITIEIQIPKFMTTEEISLYQKLQEIASCQIRDNI